MKKTIPFKDNKGRIKHLPADLTIEQLVKQGIRVHFAKPAGHLPPGWYRSCPNTANHARSTNHENTK